MLMSFLPKNRKVVKTKKQAQTRGFYEDAAKILNFDLHHLALLFVCWLLGYVNWVKEIYREDSFSFI